MWDSIKIEAVDIIPVIGIVVVEAILSVANLLVHKWVPGVVAVTMVLVLLLLVFQYRREVGHVTSANFDVCEIIQKPRSEVTSIERVERDFTTNYIELKKELDSLRKKSGPIKLIADAWDEFTETLITPKSVENGIIRNTVRPHEYFNRDTLLVEHTHWRQVPGIFVSIGLLLTFLGLIAALTQASGTLNAQSAGAASSALIALLTVASSKFIMSLTGLFCSIIFTLVQRHGSERIDESFHELCSVIESRVSYQGAESLALEQVEKFEDFRQDMKIFSANLVAQLGKSLSEDLPKKIQQSMSEVIGPIIERVGSAGSDGVGDLVDQLSKQMGQGLDGSMENMSKMLDQVTSTLSSVAARTEDSSGQMKASLETALIDINNTIGKLNSSLSDSSSKVMDTFQSGTNEVFSKMSESLDQIRANTADSARVLDEAAQKILEAATNYGESTNRATDQAILDMNEGLQSATEISSSGIQSAADNIVHETEAAANALHSALTEPIDALSSSLNELGSKVTSAADRVSQYANSVGDSVRKTEDSNSSLELTVETLNSATGPVRDSAERMGQAASEMRLAATDSASSIKTYVEQILNSTITAIEGIKNTSDSNSQIIRNTTNALETSIGRFGDIVERYDTIDENLGEAFSQIESKVKASVDAIKVYAIEVHSQNTDALNRLRQVVESIDQFTPPR